MAGGPSMSTPSPASLGRDLGEGALFASLGMITAFVSLGLNSILVARIEGPDGVGLVALSTQAVLIVTFVAGIGLRTSVAYRLGARLWSAGGAARGAIRASFGLGLAGAALGGMAYVLLRDSALSDFNAAMAACLLGALPFALLWWILPAIPLAQERFETYALLTISAPVAVLLLCPASSALWGATGTAIGFAAGFVAGGLINLVWALGIARSPTSAEDPDSGLREAGSFGARAWINDLFQFINLRPDLFILSAYFAVGDTGVYSVTVSITSLVWILSQPLASVMLPRT